MLDHSSPSGIHDLMPSVMPFFLVSFVVLLTTIHAHSLFFHYLLISLITPLLRPFHSLLYPFHALSRLCVPCVPLDKFFKLTQHQAEELLPFFLNLLCLFPLKTLLHTLQISSSSSFSLKKNIYLFFFLWYVLDGVQNELRPLIYCCR